MQCSQRRGETGEGEIKGMTEGAEEGHEEELCVCQEEGPAVPRQQFQGVVSGEACRWQVDMP